MISNTYCKTVNCGSMRGPNSEGWVTSNWEWICEDCYTEDEPGLKGWLEERLDRFPVQPADNALNDKQVAEAYYEGKEEALREVLEFLEKGGMKG